MRILRSEDAIVRRRDGVEGVDQNVLHLIHEELIRRNFKGGRVPLRGRVVEDRRLRDRDGLEPGAERNRPGLHIRMRVELELRTYLNLRTSSEI